MEYALWDVAPTAAAILNFGFSTDDGRPLHEVVEYLNGTDRLIILIVDSLGYKTYRNIKEHMPCITGLVLGMRADSKHTTPAIATILLGQKARRHCVINEKDIYSTYMDTVLEAAEQNGLRSALIIEEKGAGAMSNRIDTVVGVKDCQDIVRYDALITEGLIAALKKGCTLAAAHLRALDRSAHENKGRDITQAAGSINKNVKKIISELPGTAVLIVGDHPLHIRDNHEEYVALIAMSI